MNTLIKALSRIGHGLLFGIGFSLAAWGAFFVSQGLPSSAPPPMSVISDSPAMPTRTASSVEFRNVEEVKMGDKVYFLGLVKNKSSAAVSGLNIEVNLFKGDKFVDQYSSYLSGSIAPGEERYFKISCGCKDSPPAEHDSYKIGALGGY